jgi:uncharacterized membrane protein YgcG
MHISESNANRRIQSNVMDKDGQRSRAPGTYVIASKESLITELEAIFILSRRSTEHRREETFFETYTMQIYRRSRFLLDPSLSLDLGHRRSTGSGRHSCRSRDNPQSGSTSGDGNTSGDGGTSDVSGIRTRTDDREPKNTPTNQSLII